MLFNNVVHTICMLVRKRGASALKTNMQTTSAPGGRATAKNHPLTYGVIFGIVISLATWRLLWGISSFGRALPWHGRGDRFESDMLHQ